MLYPLSYRRPLIGAGEEDRTPIAGLEGRCSTIELHPLASISGGKRWSGREDLNLRPPAPKAGALAKLRHAPIHFFSACRTDKLNLNTGNPLCQLDCAILFSTFFSS